MPERTPLIKVSQHASATARAWCCTGAVYDEAMAEALRIRDGGGAGARSTRSTTDAVIAGQGTHRAGAAGAVPGHGGGGGAGGRRRAHLGDRAGASRRCDPRGARGGRGVGGAAGGAAGARGAAALVTIAPADTIADGIAVRRIGEHTFPMIEQVRGRAGDGGRGGDRQRDAAAAGAREDGGRARAGAAPVAPRSTGCGRAGGEERGDGALRRQHRRERDLAHHRAAGW